MNFTKILKNLRNIEINLEERKKLIEIVGMLLSVEEQIAIHEKNIEFYNSLLSQSTLNEGLLKEKHSKTYQNLMDLYKRQDFFEQVLKNGRAVQGFYFSPLEEISINYDIIQTEPIFSIYNDNNWNVINKIAEISGIEFGGPYHMLSEIKRNAKKYNGIEINNQAYEIWAIGELHQIWKEKEENSIKRELA